jgi:replication factor C small subunit
MSFEMMWVEKYRPKLLSDIINQDSIKSRIIGFIRDRSLPHLLFSGPPGTGKTTMLFALAHELYGKDGIRGNLLELNASDARGIDTIRNQVKEFARTIPFNDAPFKIICLDEADNLTSDAQHALRRTMEKYVNTSRFVLICNYPSKIIEPIQSRCAIFRFTPLKSEDVIKCINYISNEEGLTVNEDGMQTLITASEGDLRKVINVLQATSVISNKITSKTIKQTIGIIAPEVIANMISQALSGKFLEARNTLHELLIIEGVSGIEIVGNIHRQISELDLTETQKISLAQMIAEVDFRLSEGANSEIQIAALLAKIQSV